MTARRIFVAGRVRTNGVTYGGDTWVDVAASDFAELGLVAGDRVAIENRARGHLARGVVMNHRGVLAVCVEGADAVAALTVFVRRAA